MKNKIFIGNLPLNVAEDEMMTAITERFSQFGEIKKITLPKDIYSEKLRGFGFVEFKTVESAKEALSLNRTEFMGKVLTVNEARDERDRKRTGGSTGGGGAGGFRSRHRN